VSSTLAIFIIVMMLTAIVMVHELGHFAVGLIVGAKARRIGLGFSMGLPVVRIRRGLGVPFEVGILPLGGFVQFATSTDEEAEEGELPSDLLENKPAWQRFCVSAAGPLMNLLLPVVGAFFFGVWLYFFGPDGAWREFAGLFGPAARDSVEIQLNFMAHPNLDALAGPVAAGSIIYDALREYGWPVVPVYTCALSVGIGLMNLMPIPGLDGADMLGCTWETVVGKRVPTALSRPVRTICNLGLFGLALYILGRDVWRLF